MEILKMMAIIAGILLLALFILCIVTLILGLIVSIFRKKD